MATERHSAALHWHAAGALSAAVPLGDLACQWPGEEQLSLSGFTTLVLSQCQALSFSGTVRFTLLKRATNKLRLATYGSREVWPAQIASEWSHPTWA
jgi:hypothetical protein